MVDTLSIDFGTSYTAAAVSSDGTVTTVAFSDGSTRIPSSVYLDRHAERLLVGAMADNQAVIDPSAYEATSKRWVGHGALSLAGVPVSDVDCVAAVLGEVAEEVRHQHNHLLPMRVLLTHPAAWRTRKLDVLREAALRAGLTDPELVPEPCAAAAYFAQGNEHLTPGDSLCVYDLGGGTFDVAVVERTLNGFEIVGPPEGIDSLGGDTFDHRLIELVGRHLEVRDDTTWAALSAPVDERWARHRRNLQIEVRRTKEALSKVRSHHMFVPGLNEGLMVTRDELEGLIRNDVDRTVEKTLRAIHNAGRSPESLAGIYLVGGASRTPIVGQRLYERFGVSPRTFDDPKLVVCKGALAATEKVDLRGGRSTRSTTSGLTEDTSRKAADDPEEPTPCSPRSQHPQEPLTNSSPLFQSSSSMGRLKASFRPQRSPRVLVFTGAPLFFVGAIFFGVGVQDGGSGLYMFGLIIAALGLNLAGYASAKFSSTHVAIYEDGIMIFTAGRSIWSSRWDELLSVEAKLRRRGSAGPLLGYHEVKTTKGTARIPQGTENIEELMTLVSQGLGRHTRQ